MCDVWKKANEEELKLNEIINIFKQLKLDVVRITGGEPFLKENLLEIVEAIQRYSRPKIVHITSNGILTERILSFFNKINNAGNIHIKISIDAVGKKHDSLRGIENAYNSAMKTVQWLAKIKKEKKFYLAINQIIFNKESLNDYRELKEICDPIKVPIHLVLAYEKVALYDPKKNVNLMPKEDNEFPCFSYLKKEEIAEILKPLKEMIDSIPDFKERLILKYDLRGLYNRLIHKKGVPNPTCLALTSHIRILPNGDVPICLSNSTIVGNLKKTTAKDFWFSKEIKKYRQLVKNCPGCWYECETIPSAIYSGDIIRGLFY
jgi:MoaA/NifB/PqqE/SkfB family radical SAM enzyme